MKKYFFSIILCFIFPFILFIEYASGNNASNSGNNGAIIGQYVVYALNDLPDDLDDAQRFDSVGYHPDIYADQEGFVYIGSYTGTQLVTVPDDTITIFIYSPGGTHTKIDAIEFLDERGNHHNYINYDDQNNIIGSYIWAGNFKNCLDPNDIFMPLLGPPDGVYGILGGDCDGIMSDSGYLIALRDGLLSFNGEKIVTTFQKILIHVVK